MGSGVSWAQARKEYHFIIKVKKGHPPKQRRHGAHLPFIGR